MPVMVRVEIFKNLQTKACLPSLLCYLLCPGYFGGSLLTFSLWDTVHQKSKLKAVGSGIQPSSLEAQKIPQNWSNLHKGQFFIHDIKYGLKLNQNQSRHSQKAYDTLRNGTFAKSFTRETHDSSLVFPAEQFPVKSPEVVCPPSGNLRGNNRTVPPYGRWQFLSAGRLLSWDFKLCVAVVGVTVNAVAKVATFCSQTSVSRRAIIDGCAGSNLWRFDQFCGPLNSRPNSL